MANKRLRRDFSRAEVEALLSYDPSSGILRWRIETHGRGGKILPGDPAGTPHQGYTQIKLFGLVYRAHHLAWLIMTGDWPDLALDVEHKDRNRANNAWNNLRYATRSQNNMNAGVRRDSRSGCRGVSFVSKTCKWHARIIVDGKVTLLGNFADVADAIAVRRRAEQQHFGAFAPAEQRA